MLIAITILFLFLFILLFVFCAIVANIKNSHLYFYLKDNHYEKWRKLTTMAGVEGASNPFNWMPYLRNHEDEEHIEIKKMKNSIRFWGRITLFHLVGVVIAIVVLIILINIEKSKSYQEVFLMSINYCDSRNLDV